MKNMPNISVTGFISPSCFLSRSNSLACVGDESTTQLINKFYQQLLHSRSGVNKAQALREAQLALINSPDFNHPFYWSAFVLVGNWL